MFLDVSNSVLCYSSRDCQTPAGAGTQVLNGDEVSVSEPCSWEGCEDPDWDPGWWGILLVSSEACQKLG